LKRIQHPRLRVQGRALWFELEGLGEKFDALRVLLELGAHWFKAASNLRRALLLELLRVSRELLTLPFRVSLELTTFTFPLQGQGQQERDERSKETGN
jgi:hypothetical protein